MSIVWIDDVTELDAANMNLLEQVARKGVPNGYAALGADGLVPATQLPPIPPLVITDADIPASITRDTELTAGLATKADTAAVNAGLALKVDRNSVTPVGATLLDNTPPGSANPTLHIGGEGSIQWGPGAAALDNQLYRRNTDGWMRLDAPGLALQSLRADQGVVSYQGSAQQVALSFDLGNPAVLFGSAGDVILSRFASDTLQVNGRFAADAGANRVQIGGGGLLIGGDSTITRSGPNALRTLGNLDAVGNLTAKTAAATQAWIGDASGAQAGKPGVVFGSAQDVKLYRSAVGILRTDGTLDANAFTINGVPFAAPDLTVKVDKDSAVVAGTRVVASKLLAGDAQPAWRLFGDGKQEWGAGGATAPDVNLYRPSADHLATDDTFAAADLYSNGQLSVAADSNLSGDVFALSGKVYFGSIADASLYRSAAATLKTDGELRAAKLVTLSDNVVAYLGNVAQVSMGYVSGPNAAGFWLGSPADTNLYRSAANTLKTDGGLQAAGQIKGLGASGNVGATTGTASETWIGSQGPSGAAGIVFGSAYDTNLYRQAAGQLATNSDMFCNKDIGAGGFGSLNVFFSAVGMRRLRVGLPDSGGVGYRTVNIDN